MTKVTPRLTSPSETERDKIGPVLPMLKHSSLTGAHGTLLRPRLHDTHTNRPGLIPHTILSRELVSPTSKFHAHEPLPCPRPILLNEEPRAIMEPLVNREFQRWERELCDNPSAPTSYDSMESDDPHPQSTTSPRATLSNSTSEANQGACPSLVHNASLPSPTGQTKGYPGELWQCDVSGASARSHFLLSGLKRSKHHTEGRGTKVIHHHVLQPKPTIHRVHHVLGKARRARTNVQDQDNDSEASMHYSVHNKDFGGLWGSPVIILIPNSSSMKLVAWNCQGASVGTREGWVNQSHHLVIWSRNYEYNVLTRKYFWSYY